MNWKNVQGGDTWSWLSMEGGGGREGRSINQKNQVDGKERDNRERRDMWKNENENAVANFSDWASKLCQDISIIKSKKCI